MRYPALMLAVLLFAGCSILEDEVARGYAQRDTLTAATFTTADVRLISQRVRPGSPHPIICTEPSPDVAKALSAAAQLSAGTPKASGAVGGASAEAVIALAGRSTALLGLRDGLYRACEAYANGAIGADAYAFVLSRYGQLMTTLFLGQDITGAAGTNAGPSVQSPPVTVNLSGGASVTAGQNANPPAAGTPAPAGTQTASGTDGSVVAPVALTRMNEDYLNLGYNPDALITACINYKDPTRVSTPVNYSLQMDPATYSAEMRNEYLEELCPNFFQGGRSDLQALAQLAKAAGSLISDKVLASPVDPGAVAAKAAQGQPAKKPAPSKGTTPSPAQVMLAQEKLKADGETPTDPPNGKLDAQTLQAVKAYQTKNQTKLKVTGNLDAATLKALGIP